MPFIFVYNALLPLLVFLLVRTSFVQLALSLILLSKWRMFAVRPRFWAVNVRANAIDIIIGVSVLAFMVATGSGLGSVVGWLVNRHQTADRYAVGVAAGADWLCGRLKRSLP